ncbi:menaquinol-cytochrome c reductase cytochrome c1 subunit precursor [Jatrophihabitans endophyticus]|uniref:Cytochrome bc1 complex cytochrome c subunit n=1 Tax=Jatrophihabitans endophyticus TaxID=1206085 RepID=A0A1M5L334_9ACTN|nr:cytochrome c [Jatrophihabitans endophyticus]SHG59189.1 menaquinol-cytochrome c reductase cytochrome c1 subunit precursor [Jatrophihabitans endophyticus]
MKGHPLKDDDIDATGEIGFEPAVAATGGDDTSAGAARSSRRGRGRRSAPRLRRRVGGAVVLLAALGAMGTAYSAFATSSGAESSPGASAADVASGRQIYENSCITCHGANLEGVTGQGPSLVGVGSAATYFQVITGRMPVAAQGAYVQRKTPKFTEAQTEQLAAYVESVGGGPAVPEGTVRGTDEQIAEGGALYRLNCASCHGTTGGGAPLSAGKVAPSLHEATDKEIYTAMLSGPENMPVFSDNSITPDEKRAIIAYVQNLKASKDPGGAGIARIGPVSEAVVIWVAGVGALMVAILWIGARTR